MLLHIMQFCFITIEITKKLNKFFQRFSQKSKHQTFILDKLCTYQQKDNSKHQGLS